MSFRSIVVVALLGLTSGAASATPVLYSLSGTFSGNLGATAFTDAAATFTFSGDTSNVSNLGAGNFFNDVGTGSFDIAGVGTGTFTSSTLGVDAANGANPAVGFLDTGTGFGFSALNPSDPALATYELTAPFSANGFFAQGFSGPSLSTTTTLGDLFITGGDDVNPTEVFTAVTSTPELSTSGALPFLALGGCLMGLIERRHESDGMG